MVSAERVGSADAIPRQGIQSVRRIARAIAGSRLTRLGSRNTMKNSARRKASAIRLRSPTRSRNIYPRPIPGLTENDVIARALAEDVGDGDVTTAATVPEAARARGLIRQKAPGVIYG